MIILTNTKRRLHSLILSLDKIFPKGVDLISFNGMEMFQTSRDKDTPLVLRVSPETNLELSSIESIGDCFKDEQIVFVCNKEQKLPFITHQREPNLKTTIFLSDEMLFTEESLSRMLKIPLPVPV